MKTIPVLNYNESCVCITVAPGRNVKLDPATDGEPTTLPLTIDEVKFVNNSHAFKSGILEFPKDIEEEVYEELRIDKTKVLKLSEIRDILTNPTKEGLIKIISITSLSDFDRIRGQFQKLKYEGHKLTLDIADIIDRRTKELFNNQIRSDIRIENSDVENTKSDKKVSELERQVQEMKALIEQMAKAQSISTENGSVNENETEKVQDAVQAKEPVKKRTGRPKKVTE